MEGFFHSCVSTAALKRFFDACQVAGNDLHAIEIAHKGELLVRWAVEPYSCTDRREMYSLSKSFCATAVGLAYDRGLLKLDDFVLRWFPEYKQIVAGDERWGRMRLRHLLTMSTGHKKCMFDQIGRSDAGIRAFFETPLCYEPGEKFVYSTGATCILAEVVRRATGMPVPQWLAQTLFVPMGIERFEWMHCVDGNCQGGRGMRLCIDDVLKFGQMILDGGMWLGKRVLSAEWVRMASAKQIDNAENGSSDWCAGYGFQFWRNAKEGFRGDGAFGQFCVVLPERQLVIAVFSESPDMPATLNALWQLIDEMDGTSSAELPMSYEPTGNASASHWDSGWRTMEENLLQIDAMRIVTGGTGAQLWLCDSYGVQKLEAPSGCWQENQLYFRKAHPITDTLLPSIFQSDMRLMASACCEGETAVIQCRARSCPHAFVLRFEEKNGQMMVTLASPVQPLERKTVLHERQ